MATTDEVSKRLGLIDTTAGKKKHAPSLWEQATSTVAGVVPGAVHLAGLVAKQSAAPVRASWDFAHGNASAGDVLGSFLSASNPGGSIGAGIAGSDKTPRVFGSEKYQPATYGQGQSFRNTYEDVIHPSRFKRASDEGAIFGKVLEDVGNVAMVAGGAGAALGGVGEGTSLGARAASRAAPVLKRIETLGSQGLDAATLGPYRLAFRGTGKLAQRALEAAPETNKFAASAARLLDPVLRGEKRLASEGNVRGRLAGDKAEGEVNALRKLAGSDEVFEASRVQLTALDEPIREATAAGLPVDEAFMSRVFPRQVEGYGVRPEVKDMLAQYHAGTLDAEVASQIDATTTAMRAVEDERTQAALRGEGFSSKGGTLDPAQLGTAPITSEIASLEKHQAVTDKNLGAKVGVAERRLRRAQAAERVPEDFGRRDVERTVLTDARQRRAFRPSPDAPAVIAEATGPDVSPRDLGVTRSAESLVRPVTETARVQGEALGLGKAADDAARRGGRTTMVGRQQLLGNEAGILGRRADRAYGRAQATGDLTEAATQAQAQQAGSSFAAGRRAEQTSVRRRTAEEAHTAAKDAHRQALEHIGTKLEAARKNPQNYPARWRPVMEAQGRWVEHVKSLSEAAGSPQDKALLAEMAADVPLLPDELAGRGLDPSHVTQGYVSDVKRETTAARLTNSLTPERKLAAEHQRGAGSDVPTAPKQTADREAQQAATRIHNEVLQGLLEPMKVDAAGKAVMDAATNTPTGYSRTAKSVLGDDGLAQVLADAKAKAHAEEPGNGAWARRRTSEAVHAAMLEKGWEAFDPYGGQTGRFAMAKEMVDPDRTVYLKKGSAAMLDNYLVPKDMNLGLQAMHAVNTKWKGLVLPFSVRWQIGDAVGNALMAWAGGGVPPWELYRQIKKVREGGAEIPDRVATHGLATDNAVQLGLREADRVPRTRGGRALKAFQGKAFGLNETINRIERSAFYLAKLEEYGGKETAGAVERAIRESNRVMGDFANLSPLERRYLTQVFPFWSWVRHITRLTGSVAIDNPARMVHMLRLSAVYADDQIDLPDWARGGLPIPEDVPLIGGTVVPLRGLEPFGDVMGGPAVPISGSGGLGIANAFRAMSPAIKLAAAGGTGRNLSRESWDLSSPNRRKDQYGRDVPTALIRHPLELASYAADQVPIIRNLRDLAPGVGVGKFQAGPVLRYDSGETRTRGHKAMKPDAVIRGPAGLGGRTDVLARQLIPFFPQVVDAKQQKAIAAKRRRS